MQARVIMAVLLGLSCSADAARPVAIALKLPAGVSGAGGSPAAAGQRRALLSSAQTLLVGRCTPPGPCAKLPAGLRGVNAALNGHPSRVQHKYAVGRDPAVASLSDTSLDIAELPRESQAERGGQLIGGGGGGPTDADRRRTARDVLLIMAGGALSDPALVRGLLSATTRRSFALHV